MKNTIQHLISAVILLNILSCDAPTLQSDRSTENSKTKSENETIKPLQNQVKPIDQSTKPSTPQTESPLPQVQNNEGKLFFANNVVSKFKSACINCHAEPRFNPQTPGPLTIYNYDNMHTMLKAGNSYRQNDLIKKIMNTSPHDGGDTCSGSFEHEICVTLLQWWEKEFGKAPNETQNETPVLASGIDSITVIGEVYGYAAISNKTSEQLELKFFVDGDIDNGTAIGTITANLSGYDANIAGDHAFKFVIPAAHANGEEHQLYVYAKIGTQYLPLKDTPYTYTAYTPKGAADYFTTNVAPIMAANCNTCHQRSYLDFDQLVDPAPSLTGTATNNTFYNKANGINHSAGDRCNATCQTVLQTWWNREFN